MPVHHQCSGKKEVCTSSDRTIYCYKIIKYIKYSTLAILQAQGLGDLHFPVDHAGAQADGIANDVGKARAGKGMAARAPAFTHFAKRVFGLQIFPNDLLFGIIALRNPPKRNKIFLVNEESVMKYILQIFTGPWQAKTETPEAIIRKLDEINARLPVTKVIIGWNTDASLYRKVGAYLHGKGIQMLLWLPVFSEVSAIAQPDEAQDVFGRAIITPIEQEGEDFVFGCPSSLHNLQIAKNIYEQYFSDCGFDGVFLDKIRSQSFVSGVPGVLSCGCKRCRKAYLDQGVDIAAVKALYEERKVQRGCPFTEDIRRRLSDQGGACQSGRKKAVVYP